MLLFRHFVPNVHLVADAGACMSTSPNVQDAVIDDYLKRIEEARVYEVATETPLDPAPNVSRRLKNRILLKREDLQSV